MTEKTFIHITPHDPLFFRGGKPFEMGEESWAESTLLPNPSVLWGAIFSKLVMDNGLRFSEINEAEFSKYLTIYNIYLYNEKEHRFLVPAPLDLFVDDDGRIRGQKFVKTPESTSIKNPFLILPDTDKPCKRLENRFIEVASLGQMYFKNYADNLVIYSFDEILLSDKKIGIKRNHKSRRSEDKHLYRVDTTQFRENWGFMIEVEVGKEKELKEKGLLKLGGEGKTAPYEIKKHISPLDELKSYYEGKTCKTWRLLLTTPAVFDSGWQPEKIEKIQQASSVGKPTALGGFDMKKRMPKPMQKAVPAGSVYLFDNNKKQDFDASGIITSTEQYKGFNRGITIPLYDGGDDECK